ncbi:hypothetical protein pb186bvf_007809 [Paramecium bursaria]
MDVSIIKLQNIHIKLSSQININFMSEQINLQLLNNKKIILFFLITNKKQNERLDMLIFIYISSKFEENYFQNDGSNITRLD